ncbi:uncharacterized protein LOC131012436 isoform X2 [Salvia miltiorrhiza]|uniref:uncharacterized protein LOC131012436 isoform X2 n=1 Tax=Salvia miltiorrhiza TaxID=226208 RepID=UPI0025AD2D3D|nr:uncharacterized protein LOC131012436 isoform X2 [Salvia miltiorrhiza]
MNAPFNKGMSHKNRRFTTPRLSKKLHEHGKKYAGNNKLTTPSISQGRTEQEPEATFNYSMNNNTSHSLIVHYKDCEFHENGFNEDSSFLDILSICKKFIDIYSVGIKISDGDARPLKSDRDVLAMLIRHEDVPCINVHIYEDPTVAPLSFKLPQDNPMLGSQVSSNLRVTNVKIVGDLKANKKVKVTGTIVGGIEDESMVDLFITISKSFDAQKDLELIGHSRNNKEFQLPSKAVGHYVVAKYSPMNEDGKYGEPVFVVSDRTVENPSPQKEKKVRGGNKNRKVASLRSGEKLEVIFFNNRPVNKNHEAWSRHLGKIVRDSNICPVRVQSWKEIGNAEKQHMWEAVKECFSNPNIELYREHTLEHMSVLWGAWRSKLYADHVKPYKNKINALKKVPRGMNDKDWEWLVTNKFLTKEFQDISERNSKNRSKSDLFMPHLTGSRPHRDIIYDKGGKNSEMPDLGVIFFETRSKNGKFKGTKEKDKYDEIVETIQSNPSLSNLELAEKCFGPQQHGIVYGYGGGVKRKTFHDWKSSYTKELEEKLSAKDEENRLLRKRVDRLEERFDQWERSGLPSE